ncbi:VOC family protein [Halobacillus salinarum]|uniref:Bleomycin resistance protein n=1 Tax=Halobacillus salinarum TaxID=2932257 RepID=A0ABY4EGZ9_9BACI|nr:VOC family protein [Halobacillus salinarum]UOQ43748.1 VOC family protein [Halobacillus salinarum]
MNNINVAPDLVPELLITDIETSLDFWCDLCGYSIRYERREEGFAYIKSGSSHVMLEQKGLSRNWTTEKMDHPYGRGVNFQIMVNSIDLIIQRLRQNGWPLFMDPEEKWYRRGDGEVGVLQFLVQDPDGYLLRFSEHLGERKR